MTTKSTHNKARAKSALAQMMKEKTRNALTCAARGCDGCNVCKPYVTQWADEQEEQERKRK